jgi:methionine-rich copper-binding protein CopC
MAPVSSADAPQLIAFTPSAVRAALVFSTDVQVGPAAVEVSGQARGPQTFTASYDGATKTLTLTFDAALKPDVYTVRVIGAFVVGADGGAALDGAANGTPGSDASLVFTAE